MTPGARRARRRGMVMGAAVASSRANKQAASAASTPAAAPTPQPALADDTVTQLTQLADLRDKGILTEDEFNAKKKQLLGL